MRKFCWVMIVCLVVVGVACTKQVEKANRPVQKPVKPKQEIIVDSHLTFEQAVWGTKAPARIVRQLQLIDVQYYSTDGKIHQGQILTNKKMVEKLEAMFRFMKAAKFPIAHAIPVVKYHWNDDLSMAANNTYSFCYRDITYSKHAKGMAIDINPYFNPMRWKAGYTYRKNKPTGAIYDISVSGTFYASHPVVLEFTKMGFRWGHTFSNKFDDHHFEL